MKRIFVLGLFVCTHMSILDVAQADGPGVFSEPITNIADRDVETNVAPDLEESSDEELVDDEALVLLDISNPALLHVSPLQGTGVHDPLVATEPVVAKLSPLNSPNLYARVSERFISHAFSESVNRVTPVSDVILGTTLRGTARMVGSSTATTLPSNRNAIVNVVLRGTIYSNNQGWNGPVTINSTATTTVVSSKQIVIDENGIRAYRAATSAKTNSRIKSLCAKCRLVERIAWKKAGQQKGQSEQIGSQHAAARIGKEVDARAGAGIAQANYDFQEKVRKPLLRTGRYPQIGISSVSNAVYVRMVQQGLGDAAELTARPAQEAAGDLAVQAHESYIANLSSALIGGVELTDERLATTLLEQTGSVPEELQITEDKEPWSITFEPAAPFSANFGDNKVVLKLRANRFTRGRNDDGSVDQEILALVQIAAEYAIEITPTGSKLTRQGDLNVDFVGQERLTAAQVATKTFLKRKFSSLFKPEFVGEGVQLKGRFARAGKLVLKEMTTSDGWLTAGWQTTY